MSELQLIFEAANIHNVVIVDDANDLTPTAKDLADDVDRWRQFFDDVTEEDRIQLARVYPPYTNLRADELTDQDEFVALLWRERPHFREALITPLFERYQTDQAQDLAYINVLTDILGNEDIAFETAGRSFEAKALKADLVIIDLFMGSAQDEESYQITVDGLKRVVQQRPEKPPLVLLMSRSGRLEAKRTEFRDSVGLFESSFRVISKIELSENGKLQRILTRLATHYRDSLKLAAFLNAWKIGLNFACERTVNLIRTLDLPDYAQIQQLLLEEEEEPIGSYIVDLFDRVLQHEIEHEAGLIDAAIELNNLKLASYPPPYIIGSKDLQALVYRSIFHNNQRLRLTCHAGSAVRFGDVLQRKSGPPVGGPTTERATTDANPPLVGAPLSAVGPQEVVVVMTPACDLQHALTKRCMLMKGTLIPLRPEHWTYKAEPLRTTVYEATPDERFMIKWDVKDFETVSHSDLRAAIAAPTGFQIVGRLREIHALDLQQKLLSSFGRIGLLNPMPGTFAERVEAYLPDINRNYLKLPIPALENHPAVVVTGRNRNQSVTKLVLCEDACEAICREIQTIDLNNLRAGTHSIINEIRATGELLLLEGGVDISDLSETGFKEITSTRSAFAGTPAASRAIGLVRRRGAWLDEPFNDRFAGKAGLILVVG